MKTRAILIALPILAIGLGMLVFLRNDREAEAVARAGPALAAAPANPPRTAASARPEEASGERDVVQREAAPSATGIPIATAVEGTTLPSNEAELRVHVVTKEKRAPLAGLKLYLWGESAEGWSARAASPSQARESEATRTDEKGRARIVVAAPGDFELYVKPEDVRLGETRVPVTRVEVGERREVEIEVPTEDDVRFFGRVCALEGGQPLANAKVELCDEVVSGAERLVDESTVRSTLVTAPDGLFELRTASWSDDFARVSAPGYAELRFVPTFGHETPESALALPLSRSAALRVRVLDAADAPVPDVNVHATAHSYRVTLSVGETARNNAGGDLEWRSATARDGTAMIADLPPKVPLSLALEQAGNVARKQSAPLVLEPGEVRDVEIHLAGGISLRGLVLDQADTPCPGAQLWLLPSRRGREDLFDCGPGDREGECATNEQGRFLFENVTPGIYDLTLAPGNAALAAFSQEVEVTPAPAVQEVTLRVQRGLYIRGSVRGPDGSGVKGLVVYVNGLDAPASLGVSNQDDGSFSAGPLVPGRYKLMAGDAQVGDADAKFARSDSVVAEAGEADVLLRVWRGAALIGRVLDEQGELREAQVFVRCKSATSNSCREIDGQWPAVGGRFETGGLPAGSFLVCATTPDPAFAFETVELAEGQRVEDLALHLRPGARIEVRIEGSGSSMCIEISHASGFAIPTYFDVDASTTVVVPPGEITLVASSEDSKAPKQSQTVTAKLGEIAKVSFRRP